MTRDLFEDQFLKVYESLVAYATNAVGVDGPDIIHKVYADIIEHETYIHRPRTGVRKWIRFKVGREIARYRETQRVRRLAEEEGGHRLEEYQDAATNGFNR